MGRFQRIQSDNRDVNMLQSYIGGLLEPISAAVIRPGQYLGTTTSDNAQIGCIGEYIESRLTATVAGSTTVGVYTSTSCVINLLAGDYDLHGIGAVEMEGGNGTGVQGRIGKATIADAALGTIVAVGLSALCNAASPTVIGFIHLWCRVSISAATSYVMNFTSIDNSGTAAITALNFYANANFPAYLAARRIR